MTIITTSGRKFQDSHPWLSFAVDLREAPASLWILLGEAQSKSEHIAGVPLRPTTAKHLYMVYLAKGASATTAIEGNTLSEEQVLQHLEGELKLPHSQEYLKQEVDNIVRACNVIHRDIVKGKTHPLNVGRIKELNRIVLDNLEVEDYVVPGEVRSYSVGVARYRGAPAEDCDFLLEQTCEWLNGSAFAPAPGLTIAYAILKAVLAHLYLSWIHPFGDGNGRTARLVEFQILICSGVPAPAAHLLSNHYNQTRAEYYRRLDEASRSGGNVIPFIRYAVEGFVEGLRSQLQVVKAQQMDVMWQNYVHDSFRDRPGAAAIRQRRLVLDLSARSEPVALNKLTEISPRIAREYAHKTSRTLLRDLRILREMKLINRDKRGFSANKELILAFLPARVEV